MRLALRGPAPAFAITCADDLSRPRTDSYRVESRPPPDAAQRIAAQERANEACRRMLDIEARQALKQDTAVKMDT